LATLLLELESSFLTAVVVAVARSALSAFSCGSFLSSSLGVSFLLFLAESGEAGDDDDERLLFSSFRSFFKDFLESLSLFKPFSGKHSGSLAADEAALGELCT